MSMVLNVSRSAARQGAPHLAVIKGGLNAASDQAALADIGVRIRAGKGETLFGEGEAATHSYKVLSGIVRLCKYTQDGRRQIADFVLPGDHFGFMETEAHTFTAEAVTDAIILSYPKSQIEHLGEMIPAFRKYVMTLLSNSLLTAQRHLLVLGRQSAKERVVSFLLRLADRTDVGQNDRLDLPMSRQDIADHLGLTIETVSRVIGDLKRSGAIVVPNLTQIILKDMAALAALTEGAE
jgi:CRP-like cAMP-binding protein